jgi:hypothetical protein
MTNPVTELSISTSADALMVVVMGDMTTGLAVDE